VQLIWEILLNVAGCHRIYTYDNEHYKSSPQRVNKTNTVNTKTLGSSQRHVGTACWLEATVVAHDATITKITYIFLEILDL